MDKVIEFIEYELICLENDVKHQSEFNEGTKLRIAEISKEIEELDETLAQFKSLKNRYFSNVSPNNFYSEEVIDGRIKEIKTQRDLKYNKKLKIKSNLEKAEFEKRRKETMIIQLEKLLDEIS